MDALLSYYERELDFLHREAREFGRRYPRMAANLQLSSTGSDDPHIGRLLEAVALLTARVNMRLGDDYAGFAENLLDALYPQHAQPRPACATARYRRVPDLDTAAAGRLVSRAAPMRPLPFKPLFEPRVSDPDVLGVTFRGAESLVLSDGRTWSGANLAVVFDGPVPSCIRLFVTGDAGMASIVRDALYFGVADVVVPDGVGGLLGGGSVSLAVPAGIDVLTSPVSHAHPGYEHLRDLFTFPDVFGYFDICLPVSAPGATREVRLLLGRAEHTERDAVLGRIDHTHLLTRCAPVVNVYSTSVTFGPSDAHRSQYTMQGPHPDMAVISVAAVHLRTSQAAKEEVVPHYYHGRRPSDERTGCFWVSHPGGPALNDAASTGAVRLMLIDDERRPAMDVGILTVAAQCCDGDLPSRLMSGTPTGVLYGGPRGEPMADLVTSPTRYLPAAPRRDAAWHLISHLRLSHTSLLGPDASVLREFLALHAAATSESNHAIDGLIGVAHQSVTRWMPGAFPPTLARGTEITLSIDEKHFVGAGLHAWVHALDRFFASYAQMNTFVQLVVRSTRSGNEIHRCPLATGTGPLV